MEGVPIYFIQTSVFYKKNSTHKISVEIKKIAGKIEPLTSLTFEII
jgi:hypothetical protein